MGSKASTSTFSSQSYHRHHRHHRHHQSAGRPLLILHILNAVFSFVSVSIFVAILPVWNANFFHSTGIVRGDWPDALPILPLFITFVASLSYLIKLGVARRNKTRPGDYLQSRSKPLTSSTQSSKVQLYITLTTLCLLLTFLILAGLSGLYRFWRPAVITSSVELSSGTASSSLSLSTLSLRRDITDSNPVGLTPPTGGPSSSTPSQSTKATFHSCTLANIFTRRCNPTIFLIGDLQIAAIATSSLVWLLNLGLLVLLAREHQYQKRKSQKSLRVKAKAKFDFMENELSKAEKGEGTTKKKIHHERKKMHSKSSSDPSLSSRLSSDKSDQPVTRPKRAYTNPDRGDTLVTGQTVMRPKQHYYNPEITASRSTSTRRARGRSNDAVNPAPLQTAYSRAVEEARQTIKPAETMRDWMAARYA